LFEGNPYLKCVDCWEKQGKSRLLKWHSFKRLQQKFYPYRTFIRTTKTLYSPWTKYNINFPAFRASLVLNPSLIQVSSNVLFAASSTSRSSTLLRIDLSQAKAIQEFDLKTPARKIFVELSGRHVIVTTDTGDNYYLYYTWTKLKLLSKLKVSLPYL
jgi:hypothetical protein